MAKQKRAEWDRRAAVAATLVGGSGAARSAPQSPIQSGFAPGHQPLRQDDPRRIGRYQLTALLGQGGMGTVYLGRSPGQRLVAVKVILSEFAADPTFRERFTRDSTSLTRTDFVVGTPGFLAPEQLTGAPITRATDVYAFGLVLCHAAGVMPLADGESLEAALSLLPSRFGGIVTRCLDHDPNGRPTPTEVLEQLSRNDSSSEGWLSPPVRTMVDLYNTPHPSAP